MFLRPGDFLLYSSGEDIIIYLNSKILKFIGEGQMNFTIEKARPSDAAEILAYLRKVGSETDNLSFGAEGIQNTVEEEAAFITSVNNSSKDVMYLAKSGGRILGIASLSTSSRERLRHRSELGISVLKEAWGRGIGNALMLKIIDFARNTAGADIIHLTVRSDNKRAIRLYEKHGFKKTGTFPGYMKINGELVDCDLMALKL